MSAVPETKRLFQQALQMHQKGLVKHAKSIYEQILEKYPAHFDACHLLGVAHMQTGSPERAFEFISRALTINADSADAHFNLGHVLRSLDRPDEALASVERAISLRPGFADYHLERGTMLKVLGRLPEAVACFEEATRLDPSFAEAHRCRARALTILKRLEEALESCEDAIKLAPRSAESHSLKGKILGKLDRLEEALASHDSAIKLNPRSAEAHRQRAMILAMLRRFEEAAESYGVAIQLDPDRAETYVQQADILYDLGQHNDALKSCERAILLRPALAEAYIRRGYALGRLHRMDEALESFNTAMIFDGDHVNARSGRAWLQALCERWELARQDFEQAFGQNPENQSVWMGFASLPDGHLTAERASEILERLEGKLQGPELATRLFLKARLLKHLRRYEESFHCLRQANQLRVTEFVKVERWRQHFFETCKIVENWGPVIYWSDPPEPNARLLVILGPSRSGKTTLEKHLCSNNSFLRGFEGGSAGASIDSLRAIPAAEIAHSPFSRSEVQQSVLAALFPSRLEEVLTGAHQVATIANPFLLTVTHLIHDLYPLSYFVFLERNPIDNAAEIFAKDFRDRYLFAYTTRDTLDYVEAYDNVSTILCQKMGRRALRVSYEDLLKSPTSVLASIHEMLGLDPPRDPAPEVEARDARSVYREYFAALCAEQGITLKR